MNEGIMKMNYWLIKHKPSDAYFPLSSRGGKRGSTYINLPFVGIPRLFTKQAAAKVTLEWWLGGKANTEYDNDGEGTYATGASLGKGDPDRIAADMEIIEIQLKEI
jgi:hypothetical protein